MQNPVLSSLDAYENEIILISCPLKIINNQIYQINTGKHCFSVLPAETEIQIFNFCKHLLIDAMVYLMFLKQYNYFIQYVCISLTAYFKHKSMILLGGR